MTNGCVSDQKRCIAGSIATHSRETAGIATFGGSVIGGVHFTLPGRVGLSNRPEAANQRRRVGDWEGDSVHGRQGKSGLVSTTTPNVPFSPI